MAGKPSGQGSADRPAGGLTGRSQRHSHTEGGLGRQRRLVRRSRQQPQVKGRGRGRPLGLELAWEGGGREGRGGQGQAFLRIPPLLPRTWRWPAMGPSFLVLLCVVGESLLPPRGDPVSPSQLWPPFPSSSQDPLTSCTFTSISPLSLPATQSLSSTYLSSIHLLSIYLPI